MTGPAPLTIKQEPDIDYRQTATLACEGFGLPAGSFTADRMRWLYERAFSDGVSLFSAYADDRRVGHIALVHQTLEVNGRTHSAVALIDLFILKAFRSRDAITSLYGAVEAFCIARGIRFILAVPNEKAAGVNVRFLKLAPVGVLDIRAGLGGIGLPGRRIATRRVADLDEVQAKILLAPYCPVPGSGLQWTADRLWARLQKPEAGYALHVGDTALLVSTARRHGRLLHAFLCAILPRPGAIVRRGDLTSLAAAACRLHRTPVYVYVGRHRAIPLPGWSLPRRLRPSQMVLQLRDFEPDAGPITFDRFETLDFDFA